MAHGFKKIETRHWKTNYRGPLLIHAAKRKMDLIHDEAVCDFEDADINWMDLPFGALLCQVNLYDVVLIKSPYTGREGDHGDFSLGRYAWFTKDLQIFDNPIPFKGKQSLFDVPNEVIQ